MSQHPSQYPPPSQNPPPQTQYPMGFVPPPYYAYPDPRAAAHRAAVLMAVVGGLGLLLGGLMAITAFVVTPQMIASMPQGAQQVQQIQRLELQQGITFKGMLLQSAAMVGGPSLVFLIVAPFVWRGGRGAGMTALVFTVCVAAFLALSFLAALLAGDVGAVCGAVLGAPLVLQCVWLLKAVKMAPYVEAIRRQMQQVQQTPYPQYPPHLGPYGAAGQPMPGGGWPAPPPGAYVPANHPEAAQTPANPQTGAVQPGWPAQPGGPGGPAWPAPGPAAPPSDYRVYLQPPAPPSGYRPSQPPQDKARPGVYGYAQTPEPTAPREQQASSPNVDQPSIPPPQDDPDASTGPR